MDLADVGVELEQLGELPANWPAPTIPKENITIPLPMSCRNLHESYT